MNYEVNSAPYRMRRSVPLPLCFQALFGGFQAQFGWIFFGFGLIATWGGFHRSEALTWWKFTGVLRQASGSVTSVEPTNAAESSNPIYAVAYIFTPEDSGAEVTGTSYILGRYVEPGAAVTVEYRPSHPQYSRIQGMRSAIFGPEMIFINIFAAVGLVLLLIPLPRGGRKIAAMTLGVPAVGTLISVTQTITENAYRMTFAFTDQQGRHATANIETEYPWPEWRAMYKPPSDRPNAKNVTLHFHNDNTARETHTPSPPQSTVLYDPDNPRMAFVPAEFGPLVTVDALGIIRGYNPSVGIKLAILPALVIVGHGSYLLSLLMR